MNLRYYELVKDYLHSQLNSLINHYRDGNYIDLPLYHNHLNKNGTRKEIDYNLGHQCIIPTNKRYWKKPKDIYRWKIGNSIYWIRYMTRTNLKHLFRNKGNFVYNYKLKKFEHMSNTPMRGNFYHIQWIKKNLWKHALK